jgi:hypothetical protein
MLRSSKVSDRHHEDLVNVHEMTGLLPVNGTQTAHGLVTMGWYVWEIGMGYSVADSGSDLGTKMTGSPSCVTPGSSGAVIESQALVVLVWCCLYCGSA